MSSGTTHAPAPSFFPTLVVGVFVFVRVIPLPKSMQQQKTAASEAQVSNTSNLPTAIAAMPTGTLAPPTEQPAVQVVAYAPESVEEGCGIFASTCSAWNGLDARGIPGLGKALVASVYAHGLNDEELLPLITTGRDTSDPANTTGIPMPPRGGNPSLTDDQLRSVIAFLRSESGSAPFEQAPAEPTTLPEVVQVAPTVMSASRLEVPVLPTSMPVTPQPFSAQGANTWSGSTCHGIYGNGNAPFAGSFTDSALLEDRETLTRLPSRCAGSAWISRRLGYASA